MWVLGNPVFKPSLFDLEERSPGDLEVGNKVIQGPRNTQKQHANVYTKMVKIECSSYY
jgi:hypothetical protein